MTAVTVGREGAVAVLTIDQPNEAVNKVDLALAAELGGALSAVHDDASLAAAVLLSGKRDVFVAGADIEQFLAFRTAEDAERSSRAGQELLNRVEQLRVPVVAAIHGACLGAGLEMALACAYRIVSDHPKTTLALPEVQLGLIPGAGGTQRLPRLVGLQAALDLILTGRNVRARQALRMGLADEMVHPAILREHAILRARELASGERPRASGAKGRGHLASHLLLESNPVGRSIVFRKARENVMAKTQGHYPAPFAAIDAVRHGFERGKESGLRMEAKLFGELAMTDVSRQLIFLFYATSALKKDAGVEEPAPPPTEVEKLGVLGAGFMGAGIAAIAVQQHTLVRLKDTDDSRLGRGLAAIRAVLDERVARKQITAAQRDDMLVLVGGTTDYTGFANCDLVIEAVFEDLALKQNVLRDTERLLPAHAVYASNTSTIPIGRIAAVSQDPERVLGMHFFSPVHKMPLLEIVVTPLTAKQAAVDAVAFGKRLGKTVIVVRDGPGFYTTRILSAYMTEAGRLLDEGATIEAVDRALEDFGFPVGPITLLDEVGLDIGGKVGMVLHEAFGARMAPPESLSRVVQAGRTGRKGKSGFYRYDAAGKKGEVDESVYEILGGAGSADRARSTRALPTEDIVERCVLSMVNEASRCLDEGILRSARDGDVGAVFGIGFPPFRGGPFRYVDSVGADRVVEQLDQLNGRFPGRFDAAAVLVDMARARKRFYATVGRPVH